MTKTLTLVISICFLICSCDNPKTPKDNTAQNISKNEKADVDKLNNALKKYEEPSQTFKVSAGLSNVVTGRKGTKISIIPNSLVTESGNPLGQNIEVELKELTNQGQLFRTNAQTVADGKLLVSGGAYFIRMTSNGEQLKLKEGKILNVQFPNLSRKEMVLFYGQRNDFGQMNWQKATETFKSTQQSKPTADTVVIRKKQKSDIDAIFDYVENGDTTMTPKEREREARLKRAYENMGMLYDEIEVNKLGWINCDRFLDVENKTNLYVDFNPKDSVETANVFLIFKDINSVTQQIYYGEDKPKFENLPVNYKIRMVAYTVRNEKVFAYSSELTIAKQQKITISLKEISDNDFKRLIGN